HVSPPIRDRGFSNSKFQVKGVKQHQRYLSVAALNSLRLSDSWSSILATSSCHCESQLELRCHVNARESCSVRKISDQGTNGYSGSHPKADPVASKHSVGAHKGCFCFIDALVIKKKTLILIGGLAEIQRIDCL